MREKVSPTCLVLAPFGDQFRSVYEATEEALGSNGVNVIWWEGQLTPDTTLARGIYDYIEAADVIVADLTAVNPNVMYEVGFAHALRKPVLPVVQRGTSIPSDLAGQFVFVYDPSDPKELTEFIQLWSQSFLSAVALAAVSG
jgi:nucleoside 2-deoxyribosyltransferase